MLPARGMPGKERWLIVTFHCHRENVYSFISVVLGIKSRALHMLDNYSTGELHFQVEKSFCQMVMRW